MKSDHSSSECQVYCLDLTCALKKQWEKGLAKLVFGCFLQEMWETGGMEAQGGGGPQKIESRQNATEKLAKC